MEEKFIELNGLVVRETKTGENDKILNILTDERGLITVSGKGISSLRNKYAASSQLLSYSTYQLRKKNGYYYITDTFLIDCFMNIRYDIEKLALANYVCDVASSLALEESEDRELLSLTLNTLYAVANLDKLPTDLIKGAFEFRAAAIEGFMPELSECGICGCEPEGDSTLDVMNGRVLCKKCRASYENTPEFLSDTDHAKILIRLSYPVLCALRYIENADAKKLFSFTLDKSELPLFAVVCERYLLNHIEHGFSSLDYYKKIRL